MIEYFYIITVTWRRGRHTINGTLSGIISASQDETPHKIYLTAYDRARTELDIHGVYTVLYYHATRNRP